MFRPKIFLASEAASSGNGWMCDDVCGAVSPPPSRARNFPQTCPCSSDEGNSRTGRNFFHSAKLCFKVSVSSAAGAATFPEAQRIVSRVFGHRASDIPLCISSRLPDMNLALARGSIADQTLPDFRIPPLLDDGSRGTVRQWMDELGLAEFESEGKVAAWVIARQSGSRAIGRQPRQPWLARLVGSRLPRTCCLEPRWQDRRPPRRADGRPSLLSEDTLVDPRTAATTQPDKLFTTATNLLYYCLQEVILKFTLCFIWRKIPTKFLEV